MDNGWIEDVMCSIVLWGTAESDNNRAHLWHLHLPTIIYFDYSSLNRTYLLCAYCVHPDSHYSSEPSLGCWHEHKHRRARTLPHPLLCPRPDRSFQQWFCGPVHPALHQPEERWGTRAEGGTEQEGVGDWGSEQELNSTRWHCATIIAFPFRHTVSITEGRTLVSSVLIGKLSHIYTALAYLAAIFTFLFTSSFPHLLQATAGCPSGPETDAAWIQPPSSSSFGIPENSSPYQTHKHTHTQSLPTEREAWLM